MPSTIIQPWRCSRCGREVSVLQSDPNPEYADEILPPGELGWGRLEGEHVCGWCLKSVRGSEDDESGERPDGAEAA